MPKPRTRRPVWATEVPQVRDEYIAVTRTVAAANGIDEDRRTQSLELARVMSRTCELWWVARPMSVIAAGAAQDMPDVDLADLPVGTSGVLVWEGGTGIMAPSYAVDGITRLSDLEVFGIVWCLVDGRYWVDLLVNVADAAKQPILVDDLTILTAVRRSALDPDAMRPAVARVERLFAASTILATTPTVGMIHHQRDPNQTRASRRPKAGRKITVARLREHPPVRLDPDQHKDGKSWELTEQHLVRGHWRQVPCGPGRARTRPVFVAPFMRGPADAPVHETDLVNIWNR